MSRDRIVVELEEHMLKQEEDYVSPEERKREIAERAADEAMSTWEDE